MKMIHTNINKHMIYTGTHINITFLTTIYQDYTPLKKFLVICKIREDHSNHILPQKNNFKKKLFSFFDK